MKVSWCIFVRPSNFFYTEGPVCPAGQPHSWHRIPQTSTPKWTYGGANMSGRESAEQDTLCKPLLLSHCLTHTCVNVARASDLEQHASQSRRSLVERIRKSGKEFDGVSAKLSQADFIGSCLRRSVVQEKYFRTRKL